MTSPRGSKYPACCILAEGHSAFSFSRPSTSFAACNACLKHLVSRLFPDKPGVFPAPAGHEADLEILYRAMEAGRTAPGSPDDKGPVVTLRIYRGELEGVHTAELTSSFSLATYLDDLRHWRKNDSAQHASQLKRTGAKKTFHCLRTARLTAVPGAAD